MRFNLAEVINILGCELSCYSWSSPQDLQNGVLVPVSGPVLEELQGEWQHIIPSGAAIDSRLVKQHDIFFCFKGASVDGHDFALDAARNGASLIIAERNPFTLEHIRDFFPAVLPPVLVVSNVQDALSRLARCHRETALAKVVAVTGTAGKTSVREVLAQVLAVHALTECTLKNFNNQIGLPLSMLNASAEASFWVMEVGISQSHDMDELGAVLRPDIALVLNVGQGHVEGLGDLGVAHYKTRLFSYIQAGGYGVYCADYPELIHEVMALREKLSARNVQLVPFSARSEECACFSAFCGTASDEEKGLFRIYTNGSVGEVITPFKGPYGAENVAAIYTVARLLGLRFEEIIRGFSLAKLPEQRFHCYKHRESTVVDDSYNANPLSMQRMLEAVELMSREADLPLYLVLGEMKELGSDAGQAHVELGRQIAKIYPEAVFWKGGQLEHVQQGLRQEGYAENIHVVTQADQFAEIVPELHDKRGLILFKGSRSNHLEELVTLFCEKNA